MLYARDSWGFSDVSAETNAEVIAAVVMETIGKLQPSRQTHLPDLRQGQAA
jgi:hypothetical protein